ncbi:MAG: aldose epimerase family protein [SAR324 cluster bacterium]|nr:aldose epimerase family protein [SAR324 cluster bacterium]
MTTVKSADGSTVQKVTITNGPARAQLISYGATLTEFRLEGIPYSLALGSPDLENYFGKMRYFGAIVGPIANRIAQGQAPLDGQSLKLAVNENGNALHGGADGISQKNWKVEELESDRVIFSVQTSDGESGLPGPLEIKVSYSIQNDGALKIEISAESEKPTFCNPAFHGYWCLNERGLSGHKLTIHANHFLPTNAALIPTGEIQPVSGTPYDLRQPKALPAEISLDTNFCLNGSGLREAARLETDELEMIVETDAPGLQVYDAAPLDTCPVLGHSGNPYSGHAGIAMEPQVWPDAPNQPNFPSITLRPGERFSQKSFFRIIRK